MDIRSVHYTQIFGGFMSVAVGISSFCGNGSGKSCEVFSVENGGGNEVG